MCMLLNARTDLRFRLKEHFYLGNENVNIYPDNAVYAGSSTLLLCSREKDSGSLPFTGCSLRLHASSHETCKM